MWDLLKVYKIMDILADMFVYIWQSTQEFVDTMLVIVVRAVLWLVQTLACVRLEKEDYWKVCKSRIPRE